MAEQVLDACPDAEWRLIFSLCRLAGLRCPSEVLTLRWGDVNWDKDRILVRAPKQEHHEDAGKRMIPIFPSIRTCLEECFELAPEGAEFVISRYRASNANLRTQLERIIRRAGLTSWPKIFHNLRALCETELEESHPLRVVCELISNSAKVAAAHYLQMTEDHFQRAANSGAATLQKPVQQQVVPNPKK